MTVRPKHIRDADQSRQTILAAAETEFASKGFSGARIDEIASRAGYNKSLIFQYFEHKLGLYRAVIACTKGNVEKVMTESIFGVINDQHGLDGATVRHFVRAAVGAAFDFMIARPTLRQILAWEAAEQWETYRSLTDVHETIQRKGQVVIQFTRQCQAAGLMRDDLDPMILFVMVLSFAQCYLTSLPRYGSIFPEHDFASPESLVAAREELIRLVQFGTLTPTCLEA